MEVYGEKPKLFTKEWWDNYFYYYKVHTIVAIVACFVIGYIVYTDLNATKYDLSIDYIAEMGITTEQCELIEQLAAENIDDVTGNEICDAYVMMLNMGESNDIQYAQAMQVKFMTEQAYSEAFVFIMSKQYADMMCESGIFEEASVWSGADEEGECVSLVGCKAFEGSGIPVDDLYLAVRKLREEETDDEEQIAKYENGKKFAKYLIDER